MLQFLFNFFLCTLIVMPYVSAGPLRFPAQIQPWAALLGCAGVVMAIGIGRPVSLKRNTWLILAISAMFVVYLPNLEVNSFDLVQHLRKSAAFLLCGGILVYARFIQRKALQYATLLASGVYLIVALLQLFSKPLYVAVASTLVPDKNLFVHIMGDRGVTSLCPEATDFGFTAAYLLFFSLMGVQQDSPDGQSDKRASWAGAIISLICIAVSKSGSGIFAAIVIIGCFLMPHITHGRRKAILLLWCLPLALLLMTIALIIPREKLLEIRGLSLLYTAITAPTELLDTTFSYRFVHNAVGVCGFWESKGLGFGAGAFVERAPEIYIRYGLNHLSGLGEYYVGSIEITLGISACGIVPMLLLEYGIFGLGFIALLLFRAAGADSQLRLPLLAMVLMSILQSFPPAYPPIWLLLGLIENPEFRGVRSGYLILNDHLPEYEEENVYSVVPNGGV